MACESLTLELVDDHAAGCGGRVLGSGDAAAARGQSLFEKVRRFTRTR